jgi:nitroreductase
MLDAVSRRRSQPKVTQTAPSHEELLPLVAAAATVADHGSLRPWRIIELRDDARNRLGAAMAAASGAAGKDGDKLAGKPLRAALLLAVVVSVQPSHKVAAWEQEATASGVAHVLSLLLNEAGWGVMWRTGHLTRSLDVRTMHGLSDNEELLGWLYVGGLTDDPKRGNSSPINAERYLSAI